MSLNNLDKNQLKALFFDINAQYLKLMEGHIATYMNTPEFLTLRKQLHEVMAELENRRTVDPPIMHENSSHGIDPDSFPGATTFISAQD